MPEFERLGVTIAAVSADDLEGAKQVVARKGLTFPILSDPEGTMLRAWGRWDEKNGIGLATTFVLRADGTAVFFEDDGERFTRRPDARRLLEVARGL